MYLSVSITTVIMCHCSGMCLLWGLLVFCFVLFWHGVVTTMLLRLAQVGSSCLSLWSMGLQVCTPCLANYFIKKWRVTAKHHVVVSLLSSAWPPVRACHSHHTLLPCCLWSLPSLQLTSSIPNATMSPRELCAQHPVLVISNPTPGSEWQTELLWFPSSGPKISWVTILQVSIWSSQVTPQALFPHHSTMNFPLQTGHSR